MPERIHNKKILEPKRKHLRHNLTTAEAALWNCIKNGALDGRKFRRQHSAGLYVMDFYCPSELLCVELDGAHHYSDQGIKRDKERTGYLNKLEIRVVRFENKLVLQRMDIVLEVIRSYFGNKSGLGSTTPTF